MRQLYCSLLAATFGAACSSVAAQTASTIASRTDATILPAYLDLPLVAGDRIIPGGTAEFVRVALISARREPVDPYVVSLKSKGWVEVSFAAGETMMRFADGSTAICFVISSEFAMTADSATSPDAQFEILFQKHPCL